MVARIECRVRPLLRLRVSDTFPWDYNRAQRMGLTSGPNSVRTKSSRRSVRAAWARCTVPATPGWSAM